MITSAHAQDAGQCSMGLVSLDGKGLSTGQIQVAAISDRIKISVLMATPAVEIRHVTTATVATATVTVAAAVGAVQMAAQLVILSAVSVISVE